jgi:uncharacterized RDD family membrane protein YckC
LLTPADGSDSLVVATPERVAFQYQIAGPGSRFLAQVIDALIIAALLVIVALGAGAIGALTQNGQVAVLIELLLSAFLFLGYFMLLESVWSGQTVGKRALRLRVVGDAGQPVTFTQAGVRNLVRLVDFIPMFYGVGLITLFINGRGKRLGDLAAGTLVVRERPRVRLKDLGSPPPPPASPSAPEVPRPVSIWDKPPALPVTPAPGALPPSMPPLDARTEEFVRAYAARRGQLSPAHREALAQRIAPVLRRYFPAEIEVAGLPAALDRMADLVIGEV